MTGRLALRVVLLAVAFAIGTILLSWWGVPVVAVAWGLLARHTRGAGIVAGLAALLAWGLLLAWNSAHAPVGQLAATLAGVMGTPGIALIGLTVVFPAALAWAGARAAAGLAASVSPPES